MSNVERLKRSPKGNLYRDVVDWVRFNKHTDDINEVHNIINAMTQQEVIDTWLKWNNIPNHTESIIALVITMLEDY